MAGKDATSSKSTDDGDKSRFYKIGCKISSWGADAAAHPFAQIGVIAFCIGWFLLGIGADLLTAALSILAITLTQMVLNQQNEREADAHRRDVAMHAKLDELLVTSRDARDEVAGIEDDSEEEIERVKSRSASKSANRRNGRRQASEERPAA